VIGYSKAFELLGITPRRESDTPSIGNNVTIYAGAKVLGNVKIGDNGTIGANSVVIQDVPPNATVMGVPAKIIWRKKPSSPAQQ
jgi:serine O-acetyltransferase